MADEQGIDVGLVVPLEDVEIFGDQEGRPKAARGRQEDQRDGVPDEERLERAYLQRRVGAAHVL